MSLEAGFSCYMTAARHRLGGFFFSSESGPGAAVSGMRHEINSGYSCYMTAEFFHDHLILGGNNPFDL